MNKYINRGFYFLSILIVCFAVPLAAFAQETKQHTIYLKNEAITADANARQWLETMSATHPKDPIQVLVNFSKLPTQEERTLLQENGITLLDYLPENTYTALVRFPVNTANILSAPVYSIISTKPEWKASDYLWKNISNQGGTVRVLVSFFTNIEPATIKQYISSIGGNIEPGAMEKYGSYKISIDARNLYNVAQWYGVSYISPLTEMVPFDLQSRPAVKGNIAVASLAHGGYALTGDSVVVGVGDNSSGIFHADLKDRITNFNPVPMSNHGAHVNGIVGGAGSLDPLGVGMATHVSLVDYLYDQVLYSTGAMFNDYHMTITNNSYGILLGSCDYAGTYDIYSRFLDTLTVQYPDVLHVFASGNDGGMNCAPYPQGFATVAGGFTPAKNDVVVGSMTDLLTQASDESRGPIKDGRLKPEIVAIGLGAYSTIGIDEYEWAAGTSMASPQVAGGVALLTQRYKQLNGGAQPHADVMKTVLLNGAMDLGNPGPDYSFGFGAMDLYRSLQILDKGAYSTNTANAGSDKTISISVPANTAQLKVMLYWNDIPASPVSSKQLVNDLDLSVTTPSAITHIPLVLDATPANVNKNATEQADHLNNIEQVTINNPEAGNYIVHTKGFNVPSGSVPYVVAYDIIPVGIKLTYPIGGEQLSNVDTIRVFWDVISDGHSFGLQLSTDNGVNWSALASNIPADTRYFSFMPTGINSGNCMIRLTRNSTTDIGTSARFAINTQPVIALSSDQCPGYVNVHWKPVPNATSYTVFSKKGPYMQPVGTTSDTVFSVGGVSFTERSYVAVQPLINGINGYRSVAVSRVANDGNCNNTASAGDIMIEKVEAPVSGRMFTSTEPGNSMPFKLKLRNMYGAACNNYTVSWQVNGGSWQTVSNPGTIPAKGYATITVTNVDLSATGTYNINVAISNGDLADPQTVNDSTSFTVLNLVNDPIDLTSPFSDDFEGMPKFSVNHDSVGVSPNAHWDFFNIDDTGRLRSFVNGDITISGSRSVSLDETRNVHNGSRNTFVGTFNMSNYDTANTEVRIDFDYILHGPPKTADGNVVTARGVDTAAWSKLYAYDLSAYAGYLTHVRSQSLTDAVSATRHNFSTSTQISIGQNDTSLIAASNFGNGMTFDNFKIYTVTNDASMASVVSPLPANCGLPSSVPLTIKVHNGVKNTLHNIQVFYSFDGGPTFTGSIDSLKGKSDINYTFTQSLSISFGATHSLNVWLKVAGDSYTLNDSMLNYHIRNTRVIASYPYLENFESGDGGYYSDGINNSWQYGTPASQKINKAASGTKAWKTNLSGNYNNLETSYLYTPCFDISQLKTPMLSFSTAMEIENCGKTLCDAAYIEYSFDGGTWRKLGRTGIGTNWYDSSYNLWNSQKDTRWHVATIPVAVLGSGSIIHFRFVLSSDPGATFEGLAIDDVHLYDYNGTILYPKGTTTVSKDIDANTEANFTHDDQLIAGLRPGEDITGATVNLYAHESLSNASATQYTMPRSYSFKAIDDINGSQNLRLYLTDSEVVQVMNDTTCPSCTKLTDAYSLGVTRYDNPANPDLENGSLTDDTGGVFNYYLPRAITWVPYDRGYYADINVKPLSEFWFNNGGPTGNFPANADYLNFVAYRTGKNVATYWYSLIDTAINTYTIERANDSTGFADITDTLAKHETPGQYSYTDAVNFTSDSVLYYRLRWTMTGKKDLHYSPVRRIAIGDTGTNLVTLDAHMTGHNKVLVNWISYVDPAVNTYKLERAIGDRSFATIANPNALHNYGQQYYINDVPGENISIGTPVHYRLTSILSNGNQVVLPIRTITWGDVNTVLNVYPNPSFDGNFTIAWNADAGTKMHVNISDAIGRSIFETGFTASHWDNTSTIAFRGPKGIYFARIDIGGKRYVAKLVYE